jgi:8-oxo-dGTP diphosphatase
MTRWRWFTRAELTQATEPYFPSDLLALLADLEAQP